MNDPLFFYHALTMLPLAGFALYDYRHHRIRNAALLAFLPWCLLSLPLAAYACPWMAFPETMLRCAIGFLSGFLLLLSVSLATNGGIGGGDIKLTAACGIVLGFHRAFTGLFLALCLLAVWHSVYMAAGKIRRKKRETGKGQAYPLAPFLWIGMLVSVISAGCM